ncbi:MAG: c-type cytochrome [Planctomycetota bacterium]|nr:c-type cytochrome [Planctomycetota bacterium]MDA1177390.1 c-type cytochrome [Planctomycetota bacterium]
MNCNSNRSIVATVGVITSVVLLAAFVMAGDKTSAVGALLKLLQSGRLPEARTEAVIEMICQRGNSHDLQVVVDRTFRAEPTVNDLQRKVVVWLTEAAVTRKEFPAGDRSFVRKLISAPRLAQGPSAQDSEVQRAAIRLASAWREESITPDLLNLARDVNTPEATQRVVVEGLGAINNSDSQAALRELSCSTLPRSVRMLAAAGLAHADLETAADVAGSLLSEMDPASEDPTELLQAFLQRKDGPERLAAALRDHRLPSDTAKRLLRALYAVGRSDSGLVDVLSQSAGMSRDESPPTPAQIAQVVADVTAQGDPSRGEQIFRRKELSCMSCHSVNRAGGQVGPDLSGVGGSSPVDYIVTSVLEPNRAVKEQYATRRFILSTGIILTGVVLDRDEVQVNIRDAQGQKIAVPVADIEEETEGPSMMPQGLTRFLTHDELVDLCRFVSDLGRPGAYAVQTAKTIQRWRQLQNVPTEWLEGEPHLELLRQMVLARQDSDWKSVYGKVSGHLPLGEISTGKLPCTLVLQGEIQVSQAGSIQISIESTENFQAWMDTDAVSGTNKDSIILSPGLHVVTVRVELSESESSSLRIEFLTPTDSTVNFEVVGGS